MYLTVCALTGVPGVQDISWVDHVLAAAAPGASAGALVARSLSVTGGRVSGTAAFLTDSATDADRIAAGFRAGRVTCDVGLRYTVERLRRSTAPSARARVVQVVTFDGPRRPDLVAAERRASLERIWPLHADVDGITAAVYATREDGGTAVLVLADSLDTIEESVRRIMTSALLPGEDPGLLSPPDRVEVLRLLHAELPEPQHADLPETQAAVASGSAR